MSGPKVGFIGIGNMGGPMAACVARSDAALTVFDTNTTAADRFAQENSCAAAPDLPSLAAASDIVVTMLPTGQIVREVLIDNGLADILTTGTVVVDMSSSEPIGTRELGAELAERGIPLIDAPVSGGVPKAVDGTLAIMIGTDDEEALARAEPVLKTMGDRLFRTGGLGTGHAMKALNNYVAAASFIAASEALIVGDRFGLDRATMIDIINNSTGRCFNTELPMKHHVLTRDYGSGFQLGLMAKDVKIAGDLAEAIGIDAPMSKLARDMWAEARDELGPTEDFTKTITVWEGKNGVTPG